MICATIVLTGPWFSSSVYKCQTENIATICEQVAKHLRETQNLNESL